jgi:CDP-diacylglycerol--serine O-phosphatidyltransferase
MARRRKTPAPRPDQPSGWIWLPNSVTAANLTCGFVSVLLSLEAAQSGKGPGAFVPGAWLILAAGVLDVLDGKLAKWTRSTSAFGMRMDSFADGISFGLAPAVLAACALFGPGAGSLPFRLNWVFGGAYFFGAVLRLARYNVAAPGAVFGFTGLPSPAAAFTVVSLFLATRDSLWPPLTVGLLLAALGWLMLSRVPYAGLKGHGPAEKKADVLLGLGVAAACYFWGVSRVMFDFMLAYDLLLGWGLVLLRPMWAPQGRTRSVSPRAR